MLLCSPLALPLLLAAQAWWKEQQPPCASRWLALVPVAGTAIALIVYGLQVQPQANLGWIALLAPAHLVLARQLWHKE